jgi:hypothetical protein
MKWLAAILLFPFLLQGTPQPRYAAPYGAGSVCTPDAPCALSAALQAGGDVWLLPGTYQGNVTVSVPGTVLASAPGTRAKIDGGVTISGAGSTLKGVEVYDSSWQVRTSATPAQTARYVNVQARDVTIDNVWLHDLAGGVYAFNGSGGATAGLTVKHSLIYNIGWGAGLGAGSGHAIYSQNDPTGEKAFEGNVLINQYGFGMHAYGSSGASAQLERYRVDSNVQVNNRWLMGGGRPLRDVQATDNRFYRAQVQFGYGSATQNQDVTFVGNWIGIARLQINNVLSPTVRLNRFATDFDTNVTLIPPPGAGADWDANSYWRTPSGNPFNIDGVGFKSFSQWQAYTGWDATSVFTPTLPTANWIDVQTWSPHSGAAIVYNWTSAPTVTIDLAPLALTAGATYQLINAQNPAERQTFTAGAPIAVPMTGWGVATPLGASAPLRAWDSRFGVWIVEPV